MVCLRMNRDPHAPAPSKLHPMSDMDWRFNSYMTVYMSKYRVGGGVEDEGGGDTLLNFSPGVHEDINDYQTQNGEDSYFLSICPPRILSWIQRYLIGRKLPK